MSISNYTPSQLRQAADLQEKIEKLQSQLAGLLGGKETVAAPAAKRGRRKMSASARARIGAAQRARWAALKATAKPAADKPAKKGRRKMSAEARARIAAAAKARWAKVRAAKAAKS